MKLNEEQKQALILDYKDGMTWDNLCKKYSTNTSIIHRILKNNNVQKERAQNATWSMAT